MMLYSSIPQDNEGLWEHQRKAKNDILKGWDECESLMLQMPTGTGKTYLFTSLVKDLLTYYKSNRIELNILLVVHRLELIDQISKSLTKYSIPHGFIQGSREQHLWQRIQVGSIMSLLTERNEMNVRRLDFDYIIIDEAHHSLSDTYKRLFEIFPAAKKLGVTATPWRFNHETFTTLYNRLITTPQISWFIRHNVLSDFDYVSIKPESEIQRMINNTEIADTGDFVNSELYLTFDNQRIRAKLWDSYERFAKGRKGIVYAINRQHALNIVNLYCSHDVKAVSIDCETPKEERKALIDGFKEGRIQVLVNVEIFTEGFDCPDVSFIQLARPTRSLALYLQQVGRGLRKSAGKEKSIILDNVGMYNYFGLPDADRDWNECFKGQGSSDELITRNGGLNDVKESDFPREKSLAEDNEEMMVVRGGSEVVSTAKDEVDHSWDITEFSLCDYYLVRGNEHRFKVYSLTKKRGKLTGGVSNVIYSYDEKVKHIRIGRDVKDNLLNISMDLKLQTILMFSAALCGMTLNDVADVHKLEIMSNEEISGHFSIWKAMKVLDSIWNIINNYK